MSTKRLGGKKITLPNTGAKLDRVFTYTLESMEQATGDFRQALDLRRALSVDERAALVAAVCPQMMAGDPATLPAMLDRATDLEAAAVELDPRLSFRPSWVRSVEGLDLDASLYLAGEEACCLDRKRQKVSDRQASVEPVRVVISTDARKVPAEAAAAFIAAARLAAQFVPLEIWWQGSWLREDGPEKGNGHVFHVPLVRVGEMDFSRLQFVLCSEFRDTASFKIMFSRAFPAGLGWGGGKLEYSTLPNTTDFIPAGGLMADAESVAGKAAQWAGMESLWEVRYNERQSGLQEFKPATVEAPYVPPTDAQRAAWAADSARWQAEADARNKAEAATRQNELAF